MLLAAISSTLALTADAVQWSGLREGRERGFRGDPRGRWMVLRDLMLGPGVVGPAPLGAVRGAAREEEGGVRRQ